VARGSGNREIATRLGVENRTAAAYVAREMGLIAAE
jgi:DNA-binding NarL/FixJ family response regulator